MNGKLGRVGLAAVGTCAGLVVLAFAAPPSERRGTDSRQASHQRSSTTNAPTPVL